MKVVDFGYYKSTGEIKEELGLGGLNTVRTAVGTNCVYSHGDNK